MPLGYDEGSFILYQRSIFHRNLNYRSFWSLVLFPGQNFQQYSFHFDLPIMTILRDIFAIFFGILISFVGWFTPIASLIYSIYYQYWEGHFLKAFFHHLLTYLYRHFCLIKFDFSYHSMRVLVYRYLFYSSLVLSLFFTK